MADPVRYTDLISVRVSPEVAAGIETAAQRRGIKPTECIRQYVSTGLRLDGFDPVQSDADKAVA